MDAFQHQQQHRYMRPPPPPADPYHHHHQLPPRPPVPPQGPWYSNQFQYHPSSQSPSPPPPPQWAPPPPPHPHSEHLPPPPPPPGSSSSSSSYPQQLPYPAHPVHHNQFAPPPPPPHPRPPMPPHFPPPHSQIPQSYPQQEWGTPNWGHQHHQHQAWDHSARSNEEDWAAKARAWADAKAAMENQNQQSQFTTVGRPEEQSHYRDQFPQSVDSHYSEIQHPSHAASSYQQVPVSTVPPHQPPVVHPLETTSVRSEPSSYAPEGHLPHTVRDETPSAAPNAMFRHGENLSTSSSVHQQEVPSSYSSVTGNEGTPEQNKQLHKLLPLPNSSSQEGHPHAQGLHHMPLADQPLDFAPRYNQDHDLHMQSSYGYHDSVAPVRGIDPGASGPSMNSWNASVAPGVAYPPMPPVMPSGPQHDSSLAMPTSTPGHAASPFSSFPGPGLSPTIPATGPPFSLGAGASLHPSASFSGDTYGLSNVSERPKKASVPNWLREEIKKAVITNSSDRPKEGAQSIEDGDDKSLLKGDQADSKSIDFSRSTEEEEEDDEEYEEAARTAAINQEIKRVLTEVLLKVTDELFDEIATKVLEEDEATVEVDQSTVASNQKALSSYPAMPLAKATAKVIIPPKAMEAENEGTIVKSSSSLPGDVLGLANYASDDDDDNEDDEIQGSEVPTSKDKVSFQHLADAKPSLDGHDVAVKENNSFVKPEDQSQTKLESDPSKTSSIDSKYVGNTIADFSYSKNPNVESNGDENTLDGKSRLKDTIGIAKSELPEDDVNIKKISRDDDQGKETRRKPDKNDHEGKNSSSGKKSHMEVESGKIRKDEKGDDIRRRQDERHLRKEKTDEQSGSKDRTKEPSVKHGEKDRTKESSAKHGEKDRTKESSTKHGEKDRTKESSVKNGEKVKESESKKRSSNLDVKEDRKESERQHKASSRDEVNRKREHARDREEDRSRHKLASDSSRRKRRRSSSISSRGRNSKDNLVNHANDSSSEPSDDSRKLHSRKRYKSPSPVKSRRRQVSRSPHSKHSQRRHSPYSSLDTDRRRSRSRSRTPVRRHR